MSSDWWLKNNKSESGPHSAKQLKAYVASGVIQQETLVRKGQDGKWLRASNVKGLFSNGSSESSEKTKSKLAQVNSSSNEVGDHQVSLTVSYPGQFFLFDVEVKLELDGKLIGIGYVKKGINTTITCRSGLRKLQVLFMNKKTEYHLPLNKPGNWKVHLSYNKSKGGFDDVFQLVDPSGDNADTTDPNAFECRVLKNGPLGHNEAAVQFSEFVGAPFRDAVARVQDDTLHLKARAIGGELNTLGEIPGDEIIGVEIVSFGIIDLAKHALKSLLLAGIGFTVAIIMATIPSVGFRDWIRYANYTLTGSLVGGFLIAALFMVIPMLFSWQRLSKALEIELSGGKLLLLIPEKDIANVLKKIQVLPSLRNAK